MKSLYVIPRCLYMPFVLKMDCKSGIKIRSLMQTALYSFRLEYCLLKYLSVRKKCNRRAGIMLTACSGLCKFSCSPALFITLMPYYAISFYCNLSSITELAPGMKHCKYYINC